MIDTLQHTIRRTAPGRFLVMLVKPARAIEDILIERPTFRSLFLFLTIISLLRGVLDGVLALLTDSQFFALWQTGLLIPWFVVKAGPLLLADWLAVYVRWLGFALVPYVLGRFCGGTGRLVDLLRLYGIILGIYAVTVVLNFAYFVEPLPMLRFEAAAQFKPTLGVGQVLTSAWLVWVTYLAVRRVHRIPAFEAVAIGVLTPALNIAALVLPGAVIFNLPSTRGWGERMVTSATLLGFSAASIILIGAFVFGVWWLRRGKPRRASSD